MKRLKAPAGAYPVAGSAAPLMMHGVCVSGTAESAATFSWREQRLDVTLVCKDAARESTAKRKGPKGNDTA